MKVGQMGFPSLLCCGWFLLMMLHSPACSANERKIGSPRNGDKDDMQKFTIGRKFGFPNKFSAWKYLAVQRRLLGDNATGSVATERIRGQEKIQESVKNKTKSETKDEQPLLREPQAKNETTKLKESLEIVENGMHNETGKNSNVAKSANRTAEEIKIEAERLSNSTMGGVGVETPTNSTEIGIGKMEGNETRSSANHTGNLEQWKSGKMEGNETRSSANHTGNLEQWKSGKTEGNETRSSANHKENLEPARSLANSTGTEIPKMQSTKANGSPNSTETPKIGNSKAIDMQRMESPTDIKTQTTKIREAETLMANSTGPELQGTESILPENTDNENPTEAEMQDPDDEYSDLMQDFADLPSKLQDTAGKVADKLIPGIQRLSNTSKVYFDIANQGIAETFSPLIGKQYAPVLASAITCILLLLPIILAIAMFDHVRAFFPLQKVVFLANIYLANYFATLAVASFIVGMEPMLFFYRNSMSGYICLQLVEGLGYGLYVLLQCLNAVVSCSHIHIFAKAGAAIQCMVSMCIGLHYYVTVFHRAMAQKPPRTCWKVHATYALLFLLLCLLSKQKNDSGKKEYLLDGNTNKKN